MGLYLNKKEGLQQVHFEKIIKSTYVTVYVPMIFQNTSCTKSGSCYHVSSNPEGLCVNLGK